MSEQKNKQNLARVPGELLFSIAMLVAILTGVHKGFALLIPADWCAGTPANISAFAMSFAFMLILAYPRNKDGYLPLLRLGAVMLAGLIFAVLATRLFVGCTPLGVWAGEGRLVLEMLGMNGILIPLGHLHRTVLEPRWSRAMGEEDGAGEEGPRA